MIRAAYLGDIPRLVEMGQRFHRETAYSDHLKANPEQMRMMAEKILKDDGWLVSERDGQICGMIGIVLFPHFLSGEMIAGEVVWWVEPEYRGEGVKLMRAAEKRAKASGAKRMQMIAPTDQVAAVYRRLGYDFVESAYQKTL